MRRILFLDDEVDVLEGLKAYLADKKPDWEMLLTAKTEEALGLLDAGPPVDLVVTDMDMPDLGGNEFLARVKESHPETVRFVLSGKTESPELLRSSTIAHQVLGKPWELQDLVGRINRACMLRDYLTQGSLHQKLLDVGGVPAVPETYRRILEEVQSRDPSVQRIGTMIGEDPGLSTRILQVINSAYLGVKHRVTDIIQAAGLLGLNNLKNMVLLSEVFSEMDQDVLGSGLSLDFLWRRSRKMGQYARIVAEEICEDRDLHEAAFAAGLLHEVGHLILATRLPEEYRAATERAEAEGIPLTEAEKRTFEANHAQIGGYLLELWGLPSSVAEAVACYDLPSSLPEEYYIVKDENEFAVLTAVHVAAYFLSDEGGEVYSPLTAVDLDTLYLERFGLVEQVGGWWEHCLDAE